MVMGRFEIGLHGGLEIIIPVVRMGAARLLRMGVKIDCDQVLEVQALKEIARGRMKVKSSPAYFSPPRLAASR